MNGMSNGKPPLTAAGFGVYLVGEAVPANGSGQPRELDRLDQNYRHFSDSDLPGMSILADDEGVVMRVSISEPSTVETVAGIGIGASEAEVRAAYPAVRERAGDSNDLPGTNLYTALPRHPGLRFEIGADGTVIRIHGGQPPFLSYDGTRA